MISGVPLGAGFDGGRIEWHGGKCLFTADRHLPEDRMGHHYEVARRHGIAFVRDGLPPWLPMRSRLRVAREFGFPVIWDLDHYWRHTEPRAYALKVAHAFQAEWGNWQNGPIRVCFNESALAPLMTPGRTPADVIADARVILAVLRDELDDVRLWTAEPLHRVVEIEAHAWAQEEAEVIGGNLYPYEAEFPIHEGIQRLAERYPGKGIALTEFGYHTDLHQRARPDLYPTSLTKADFLRHTMREIERSGVKVVAACLYPFLNSADWNSDGVRLNGLIRTDGTPEADLSEAIREVTDGHRWQGILRSFRPDGSRDFGNRHIGGRV